MPVPPWSVIILAGGRSTRFGSDKAVAELHGRRLIDHVLAGIPDPIPVVIVGPDLRPLAREVEVVREDPPFGGPVAALDAGLRRVSTSIVALLAADMPHAAAHVVSLVQALGPETEAVIPVDSRGRVQYLCGAYRRACLERAVRAASGPAGGPSGLSMRAVVSGLQVATVTWPDARSWDVDTPADLARHLDERDARGSGSGEHVLAIEADDGIADEHDETADR
ncbi:MAG: molybdenum cofactor guanylyltransferase [Actinomycetales bacterium]|nr:molybdenum cofactor guanylyltransferase [Actinomycetales bacterium]